MPTKQKNAPVAIDARDADLLARAEDVAARLKNELGELLAELPPGARGGSALSRWLDIDRATCQRAIAASRAEGLEVLSNLPGVQGLEAVVKALADRSDDPSKVDGARAALAQFERLVEDAGGSRARLLRRLESSTSSGHLGADDVAARKRLFGAARDLCGRWSDINGAIFIYRPTPGDPDTMESAYVSQFIGHRARAGAIPLTSSTAVTSRDGIDHAGFRHLDATPAVGRSDGAILERFSTMPAPVVTTRTPDKEVVCTIDAESIDPVSGADIVIARRVAEPVPHPLTESPQMHEAWMLVENPSRHLLFDVYMHRALARQCIASMSAHLWRPDIDATVGRRWRTRFPRSPKLELLGSQLMPSNAYARQAELTQYVFDALDWAHDEFVGFRCALEYPIWRAGYCMTFDFTPDDD